MRFSELPETSSRRSLERQRRMLGKAWRCQHVGLDRLKSSVWVQDKETAVDFAAALATAATAAAALPLVH